MSALRTASILLIALVLAACSGAAQPSSDPSATADLGSSSRTIEHAAGTTEVPADAEAVIGLDGPHAVPLIALGITPVAASESLEAQLTGMQHLLPEDVDLDEIESIGDGYDPSLERIAVVAPDLIIGDEFHADFYDEMSAIAPTVLVEYGANGGWRERFSAIAEAVGREAEAEEVDAAYDDVIAGLPAELADLTVAFVRPSGDGNFRIDSGAAAFPGSVAEDAAISTLAFPDDIGEVSEGSGFVEVSGENLGVIAEADLVVVADFTVIGDERTGVEQLADNPLWAELPPVQDGRVLEVPGLVYNGGHHYAATALLQAIAEQVGGTSEAAADGAAQSGTRTFTDAFGEVEIPADPQRIVTPTQDQNALLPLLELGVRPIASAGHVLDDGTQVFRRTEGYDTSGIEWIGRYGSEIDLEAVALQRPDLIVVEEFGAEGNYDLLGEIAPTAAIQIFDRPLTEVLMDFADLVGETEQAEQLQAAYTDRVEGLLEDLGDRREDMSISVISAGDPGLFYRADEGQAIGTVMDDLDLLRPEPQRAQGGDFEEFSVENLDQHDADVLLLISFAGEDQDPGQEALTSSPTWDALRAVQAGQAYVIDGLATVGSAWGKMDTFLAELERILLAEDLDVDVVEEDGS
jgi:iron complex transport system substrate-binding protein